MGYGDILECSLHFTCVRVPSIYFPLPLLLLLTITGLFTLCSSIHHSRQSATSLVSIHVPPLPKLPVLAAFYSSIVRTLKCDDIGHLVQLSSLKESQESQMRHHRSPRLAPVVVSYGQCHFTARRSFYILMSPMLGHRLSRGHLITFAHLSPPYPSIHRQVGLYPLLFVGVSMVDFEGQSVLLGYNK